MVAILFLEDLTFAAADVGEGVITLLTPSSLAASETLEFHFLYGTDVLEVMDGSSGCGK